MQDFVHLHVHTQYSILDGQASVGKLVSKALKNGMRGMAITDHGNMMGIKEYFNEVNKVWGKAQGALAEAQEKKAALTEGTYKAEGDEAKCSTEELLAKCDKQISEAQKQLAFKPIFGCEMYVAHRRLQDHEGKGDMSGYHLIVLAKNEKGYHNLVKLVSKSWTDGFYMRPRTDRVELEKYHEGLIVSSACLGGEIPQKIMAGDMAGAEEALQWYKRVFGEDYYLELQRHEVKNPQQRANRETYPLQQKVNVVLLDLAKKYNVKIICSNDCHFVDEINAEAHDRLICLSTGKDLDDPNRMLYTKQEWFKTREEMNDIFSDVPEALSNTCEICDKVETYSIDHAPIMPNFPIPEEFGTEEKYREELTEEDLFNEFTRDENGNEIMSREEGEKKIKKLGGYDKLYRIKFEADYLKKLTYEGAEKRYGAPLPKEVDDRVKFELHTMKTMGFPGYFLIVQDYINAARNQLGVSVGPGRGSAAGSVVAYCLGITQIDPIKYDLLFERFLNPDRISLPDIDVDFDDDGRGRVLQWVTDKYGADNCAHIITYGTMATKLAIKDVARVQKLPLNISNQLCKAIPDKLPDGPDGKPLKMNLPNAISVVPELMEAAASTDPLLADTIKYATMLEGNVRNTGVHACGFIICRDKISDWVPISVAEDKETHEKLHCTQYEGKVIEDTGLIKMDFLGLKTLSLIKEALENIKQSLGIEVDIDNIDINDPATYKLYCEGRTIGTFQFESAGMQKYLRELQPSTFEDLIAMNALYRPGPMQYIPQFIKRKHGEEPITYDLDCMERYLKDTYGITVYQEQVMLLSREIAGFTRGESDTLRKAMGKKLIEKLNHLYPKFIKGGKAKGHDEKILEKIWSDWKAFASYAFNKSHATCYSWVAFQTAYLKANYPAQYMAGCLSRNLANISEITKLMAECKAMGIHVLSPDINESNQKFGVNHTGDIRFGMAAVKNVGEAAVQAIIDERTAHGPYKDIFDFVQRVNLNACNRKSLESLILAGAFDSFSDIQREQYFATNAKGETFLETLIRFGQNYQADQAMTHNSLFGDDPALAITNPPIPQQYERWSDLQRLNQEKDLVGIYLSAHPLDTYAVVLQKLCTTHFNELNDLKSLNGHHITLGGIVTDLREGQDKRGKPYGIVKLEDFDGPGEIRLFGDNWARWRNYLLIGNIVYITASVSPTRWDPERFDLRIEKIEWLVDVKEHSIKKITIYTRAESLDPCKAVELVSLATKEAGNTELYVTIYSYSRHTPLRLKSRGKGITITKELLEFLDAPETKEQFTYKINDQGN